MLMSNPLEIVACEKCYQRKSDFFTVWKKFFVYNFLGEMFTFFSTDSNSASTFALNDTHNKL
jgi:hypothetical protein